MRLPNEMWLSSQTPVGTLLLVILIGIVIFLIYLESAKQEEHGTFTLETV